MARGPRWVEKQRHWYWRKVWQPKLAQGLSSVEAAASEPIARSVSPEAAEKVFQLLSGSSQLSFVVASVRKTSAPPSRAHTAAPPDFDAPDLRILDSHTGFGPCFWLMYLTRVSQEEAAARFLRAVGHDYAVEVHSGPHERIPLGNLDLPCSCMLGGFKVRGFAADLVHAACSIEAEDLLKLLDHTLGDVSVPDQQGVTAVHLAALAGDIALAEDVVRRAVELKLPREHWQDADGRTPLHLAVFLNSGRLVRPFLDLCGADATDRWGHTAADLALALEHWDAHACFSESSTKLRQVNLRSVHDRLRAAGPKAFAALTPARAAALADQLPLHDYGLLSQLAAAHPEAVDVTRLARSMSCFECWYSDLASIRSGAALGRCRELLFVWDDLPSFCDASAPTAQGAVLVEPVGGRRVPKVADKRTFLQRFHRRTDGVLRNIDWSNLMVMGGLVLACLTADDDEFEQNYAHTDIDIYVVGLRGEAFKKRVFMFLEEFVHLGRIWTDGREMHKTALRTPHSITVCIWNNRLQRPVPNVQVSLVPYDTPAHLLYTTDIDCSAVGFDGKHLVAAPRAREAIRHGRIVARPEKYMVRGEQRTEAELLKYAVRGFQVLDLGLKTAGSASHPEIEALAERLLRPGSGSRKRGADLEACIKALHDTGVRGPTLLRLAAKMRGLRRLLLHETSLLPAGLQWEDAMKLVVKTRRFRHDSNKDVDEKPQGPVFTVSDGYGKMETTLALVNLNDGNDRRLQGFVADADEAIEELDLASHRFEVRGWYDGVPDEWLNGEHALVDPKVWRGVGDFRPATWT